MGVLSDALDRISSLVPERKVSMGATVPTWEQGSPQYPRTSATYWQYAFSGYSRNEIVYACVEELSTSAAEPRIAAMIKKGGNGKPEQVPDHPLADLFERPNPFMSRYHFIASLIMYRSVSGNAYVEKVRSASGKVVELWPLRPDRMFVIPDKDKHIKGWEYRLEGVPYFLPAADVIQTKTRNPLDDWYGLPPLAVSGVRVETDNAMRSFTWNFFQNAGVPAGLLTLKKETTESERRLIQNRFRNETAGPGNWHNLLVLDNVDEVQYQSMGMPLGQNGLVMPDLDTINEVRLAMAFGVPLELIGARVGMIHGNRTTMKEARGSFWDETLVPLYQEMASDLSMGLVEEPWDGAPIDYLEFDLSTVHALAEDDDAKHARTRSDLAAGIISVQEARADLGREPDYDPDAVLLIAETLVPQRADQAINAPVPRPLPAPPIPEEPVPNGNGNGHKPADLAALATVAKGKG